MLCVRTGVCMFSQPSVMKPFVSNNRLIMLDVNLMGILIFTVHPNVQKTLPGDLHCLIYKVSPRKDTALQSNMFTLAVSVSGSSDVSCMLIYFWDLQTLAFF